MRPKSGRELTEATSRWSINTSCHPVKAFLPQSFLVLRYRYHVYVYSRKVFFSPGSRAAAFPDLLGASASLLCLAHCVLTPILVSFSAVFSYILPAEESTHRFLAVATAAAGLAALVAGYRRHRRLRVPLCMAAGLALIGAGAWWGDRLPSHKIEVLITMLGSGFMIAAHRLNHTFCRNCECASKL